MNCNVLICSENKEGKCNAPEWFVDDWKLKAEWCPLGMRKEKE
jgi:hypothetical protein